MSAFTTMSVGSIFFYVFAFALLVQLWYYLFFFKRLAFYKKKELNKSFPPASIIICVRNEEDNLVKFLHFIFEQDYPDFEVVVVNYCSFDNTADILKELAKKYSNLTDSNSWNYIYLNTNFRLYKNKEYQKAIGKYCRINLFLKNIISNPDGSG